MSGYAMGRALAWALVWAVSGPGLGGLVYHTKPAPLTYQHISPLTDTYIGQGWGTGVPHQANSTK